MAFSFLSFSSQDETISLLVDIGSASVGGALVKTEKGKPPHVLRTTREDISFQDALSANRFLVAMNRSLDKVLKTLQAETKTTGNPAHIFCTLSSPWFILKTRDIHIARENDFVVTEKVLDDFINEDIARMKEELKETLPPDDVKIIEKKIIQMKLNGYEIKNPYGQKISRMELLMTVGVSSGKVIESIERKLGNFFHVKSVHFGAFPIAAFSAIRDIFPTENNFLFLDVTGEATDVSLVNNDLLVGTLSFSRGKNFFVREISAELRTVHEEAATLFAMFLRNELDPARQAEVASVVTRAENEWLTRFEKTMSTLAEKGAIPRKVFFTTDASVEPLFSRLIGSAKSDLLMRAALDVQYLDQLIVANFVSFETEIVRDPFLVIEALLAEKIFTQHT